MIGQLFGTVAAKIAAGAVVALLIALGVVMWRADAISGQRDALRTALATEEARHAVTRASVDTLSLELQRFVAEGKLRQAAVEKAMERVADETAPLAHEARRIEREGLGEDYVRRMQEAGL